MKKVTLTIITAAALAFAMPLYATDKIGNESDYKQNDGVTQQGMGSDSQPSESLTQPGMESDYQRQDGLTQQGLETDSQRQEGLTQQGLETDSQRQEGLTQQGLEFDSQQREGLTQQGFGSDSQRQASLMTADELKGLDVVSQTGEDFGKIKNITIDEQSGEVQFITFSRGGILGIGAEEIAAPLSAFEFSDDQAILTVDQSKLDNVPKQTAGAADSDYVRDLETHYGVAPAWDEGNQGDTTQNMDQDQDPLTEGKVDTQSYDSGQLNAEGAAETEKADTKY